MDVSSCQLRTQVVRTLLRLGDCDGSSCLTRDLTVLSDLQAREEELLDDLGRALVELHQRREAYGFITAMMSRTTGRPSR